MRKPTPTSPRRLRALPLGAALLAVLAAGGCDTFLDVENPNNIKQADLQRVEAAEAAVNGAFGTVTRGLMGIWGPYSTVTDEIFWVGSRDAWIELDQGLVTNPRNEFLDDAFKVLAEGRWMADEAIELLEGFRDEGAPVDPTNLARAYLYGAIAYVTIADQFDSYVLSDRREAGQPIAPDQMDQFYRTALDYLDAGLAIAQQRNNVPLMRVFTAMQARTHYSLALWQKLNPAGNVPANPLVSDPEATAAAERALDLIAEDDWFYRLDADNGAVAIAFEVSLPYNVNRRKELQIGTDYVLLDPKDDTKILGIALEDPIDDIPDPVIDRRVTEFRAAEAFAPYTVVSSREMHLIIAEAALANGNIDRFREHINEIRALDGLTPFTGQIPALEMLQHARRVNLFLQGRRLADLYRFGLEADLWTPSSAAATQPGTFFPITITECRANPNVNC